MRRTSNTIYHKCLTSPSDVNSARSSNLGRGTHEDSPDAINSDELQIFASYTFLAYEGGQTLSGAE